MAGSLGKLIVEIGAVTTELSKGLKDASSQTEGFAKQAAGSFVTYTEEVRDSMGMVTTVTKQKFVPAIQDVGTKGKAVWEEYKKSLNQLGESLQSVGSTLTRYVSLPLGGLATAAFASSERAKTIFKNFGSDVQASMGRLGDQLVEDLRLDETMKGISSFVERTVKAFRGMPEPVRNFTEALVGISVVTGPAMIAMGSLLKMAGNLQLVFGKLAMVLPGIGLGGAAAAGAVAAAGFATGKAISGIFETERGNVALGLPPTTDVAMRQVDALTLALAQVEQEKGIQATKLIPAGRIAMPQFLGLEDIQAEIDAAMAQVVPLEKKRTSAVAGGMGGGWAGTQYFGDEKAMVEAQLREITDLVNSALRDSGKAIEQYAGESATDFLNRMKTAFNGVKAEVRSLEDVANQKNIWDPIEQKARKALANVDLAFEYSGKTLEEYAAAGEQKIGILTAAIIKMRQEGVEPTNDEIKKLREELEKLKGETIEIKVKANIEQTVQNLRQGIGTGMNNWQMAGGGSNPIADTKNQIINARSDLLSQGVSPDSQQIRDMTADAEKLSGAWATFMGQLAGTPPMLEQVGMMLFQTYQTFTQGIGNAFAQILVYGQSAKKTFAELGKAILAQMISMTTTMIAQWAIMKLLGVDTYVRQTIAGLKSAAALTFANTFAGMCTIPLIGIAVASGAAAAATGAMLVGAAAAGGLGAAAGVGLAGAEEGGIFTHPGITRISERGHPEIVLNQTNIQRYFPELLAGGRGGGTSQLIQLILDGRVLAESNVRNQPDVIRLYGLDRV